MTTRLHILSTMCLLFGAFAAVAAQNTSACFTFNLDTSGWINTGLSPWEWSANASPNIDDIPTYIPSPTGHYLFFQPDLTKPNTGTIRSTSPSIELWSNSEVKITIYRHLSVFNGVNNPVLNFVTNGGTNKQPVLWSYNYDTWDRVSLICGSGDEPCCLTYPCVGYFSVDGEIDGEGDLLCVDSVSVNEERCV